MSENWRISKNRHNLACSPWNGAICIEISDDIVYVPPIVAWTTRGSEDKANLIAAAPTMREYISKCAASGDVEAAQILDSIDVRETSDMSHTPGPWKATLRELRHSVHGPEGQYIADLMWRGNDKKEEQSADANLIAAAPELLDALQRVERHFRILPTDQDAPGSIFAQMTAAIAKATGGHKDAGTDTA